jgi:hypothetical protein
MRSKLLKLASARWGNHYMPDNDDGRAMLTALLHYGLTDENAAEHAPWCGPDEFARLKRNAQRIEWKGSGKQIGKLICLTFIEWKAAKLWAMRPIDKTEKELDAFRADRTRELDRKRKQMKREQRETMLLSDDRCNVVMRMLETLLRRVPMMWRREHWTPVSELVAIRAWCGRNQAGAGATRAAHNDPKSGHR